MKFSYVGCSLILALASVAYAGDMNQNAEQQAGQVAPSDLKTDNQAKVKVGSHSVMIETQLMSAKAQIDGLRSRVALEQKPDADFLNQVKSYSKNIDTNIKLAQSQDKQLSTTLQKSYPQVATNDDVKNLNFALSDLQDFYKAWSGKTMDRTYWQDRAQAKADIDSLSMRMDKAIDSTKNFNSDQLDISLG